MISLTSHHGNVLISEITHLVEKKIYLCHRKGNKRVNPITHFQKGPGMQQDFSQTI